MKSFFVPMLYFFWMGGVVEGPIRSIECTGSGLQANMVKMFGEVCRSSDQWGLDTSTGEDANTRVCVVNKYNPSM